MFIFGWSFRGAEKSEKLNQGKLDDKNMVIFFPVSKWICEIFSTRLPSGLSHASTTNHRWCRACFVHSLTKWFQVLIPFWPFAEENVRNIHDEMQIEEEDKHWMQDVIYTFYFWWLLLHISFFRLKVVTGLPINTFLKASSQDN